MSRLFRRGAHHQNGFRPTVAEIAADIKRRRSQWRWEVHDGRPVLIGWLRLYGIDPGATSVHLTVAPPGGIANLPALITESEVMA